jgi:hypothetical protein
MTLRLRFPASAAGLLCCLLTPGCSSGSDRSASSTSSREAAAPARDPLAQVRDALWAWPPLAADAPMVVELDAEQTSGIERLRVDCLPEGCAEEQEVLFRLNDGWIYVAKLGTQTVVARLSAGLETTDARFFLSGSAGSFVLPPEHRTPASSSFLLVSRWHAGSGVSAASAHRIRVNGRRLATEVLEPHEWTATCGSLTDEHVLGDPFSGE